MNPYGAIKFGEFKTYMTNKQAKLKDQEKILCGSLFFLSKTYWINRIEQRTYFSFPFAERRLQVKHYHKYSKGCQFILMDIRILLKVNYVDR